MLTASTTLSYRSKTFQFETPSPFLDQKGYALWDAALIWRDDDDRFSFGLNAKNILNKQYITSGYQFLATAPDGTPTRNAAGQLRADAGHRRRGDRVLRQPAPGVRHGWSEVLTKIKSSRLREGYGSVWREPG